MTTPRPKRTRTTDQDRAKLGRTLKPRYEAGESIRQLATETGKSYGFVHRVLKEAGVTLRPRGGAPGKKNSPAPAE